MLNRFPRMLQEYYVGRVRAVEADSERRKAKIRTRSDAEEYVRETRGKVLRCFGPFPERTPLLPQVTGVLERDSYRVEKLLFQSRPNFFVTANLYVPKGRSGRMPGVVASCGHSVDGKTAEPYQSFAQGLARLGYVCLIFDPIGQGERLQYPNGKGGSTVGVGTGEHLQAGNPQFLIGEFFGAWRAWDGIRALDYLLTRPEVDPRHVGITGNSGGGTLSTWLFGLDPRWTMGAPSCFVTTFRRNLENELPADTEQCPPHALALGLDHDDFLAPAAPRPLIVLTKEKDYFDQRGSQEAFARLKRLYTAFGRPDDVEIFTGPTGHGYSQENREAMYRFFNRVTGASDAKAEPALKIEDPKDLQVTMTGQVEELHSHSVMFFTGATCETQALRRGKPRGQDLRRRVLSQLQLPARSWGSGAPDYRILRPLRRSPGWPRSGAANYAVETEPGIQVLTYMPMPETWYSRPPQGAGDEPVLLYVPHLSSDLDLSGEPLLHDLAGKVPAGKPFFCADLRGMGDSQPNTCGPDTFRSPYGCDYFYAVHGVMLDRSLVAQRVHDLLSVVDWLADHGYRRVHLAARGHGSVPAALAALLDDRIVRVTLKNPLVSWSAIAEADRNNWPLSAYQPAVLRHFDLPDVYAELEARKSLVLTEPWGPMDFTHTPKSS